jgi:hypothetical protein
MTGLSNTPVMTSLQENSAGGFDWLSGAAASFLNFAPESPKAPDEKCAGITDAGLEPIKCDAKHDFGCEAAAKSAAE